MARCKHAHTWLIEGGRVEWCYGCGAFRQMTAVPGIAVAVRPFGVWARPVGDGPNPYERWVQRSVQYRNKRGLR